MKTLCWNLQFIVYPIVLLPTDIIKQSRHIQSVEETTATTQEVNSAEDSNDTENESEESSMSSEQRDLGTTTEVQVLTQRQQSAEAVTVENSTPITITITRPTKKPVKKPKPVRTTTTPPTTVAPTIKPAVTAAPTPASPTRRYPCLCGGGLCSCCTGIILENFNVPFRSRACANVTYDPDDFAFNFKLLYNDRLLYNNRMSGTVRTNLGAINKVWPKVFLIFVKNGKELILHRHI